jgi:16S rRNA (cytidine1402-2'-O)-methyltransferase
MGEGLAPGAAARGRLLLVPNALDAGDAGTGLQQIIADGVLATAAQLRHWVVEDARSARAFLKRVAETHPLAAALQELHIRELPRPRKGSREAVPAASWQELLQPALQGHDVGLLSEAGLPAVADPGADLVAAAHRSGIAVVPLPGASSLLLALAASGLNGQSFAFVGYLPQDAASRSERIRELEQRSRREGQTQVLIETPYRNAAIFAALVATLAADTRLAVSSGLSWPGGFTRCMPVRDWRMAPVAVPADRPAVFCLLAG